jgi:hypothetical protein
VTEGGVPEVVRKHHCLGEVLVEAQHAGERSRDLAAFDRVGEAVPVVIALVVHEDLGLVLEAPERAGVHDAVAVPREGGAVAVLRLGMEPAARVAALLGVRGEAFALLLLGIGAGAEVHSSS